MAAHKTHRLVKEPQVSARYLADYMAASEQAKRTIIRGCKYQPIARVVQHDDAKMAVARAIRLNDPSELTKAVGRLSTKVADTDFDQDVIDHNISYINRFAAVLPTMDLPDVEFHEPGPRIKLNLNGVRVSIELQFRLQRLTKTNKIRVGAGMLRYAKGKALSEEVGAWQSSLLYGHLRETSIDDAADPEGKLCITVDAHLGVYHPAPGDAVSRYKNMAAACETIYERWPNIAPPPKAVL